MKLIQIRTVIALLAVAFLSTPITQAADWHQTLYLPGEDCWRGRIRVTVHNDSDRALVGRPVPIQIGDQPGQAGLVGERAEAVRVCDERGTEFLFALVSTNGDLVTTDPVSDNSQLIIPAECPAEGSTDYFVYFDNPTAGRVPDFLPPQTGFFNGDVERGHGETPFGWKHDQGDDEHVATWSDENPQSGRRCLKTVVAQGAEPTWISTRQSNIPIDGGTRYRMTAWVRTENVVGNAGWYIHVGDERQPMIISPMLLGGGGTYDWKQVKAEFTAPAEATRADLGTVLRGTGTAWFDNVELVPLSEPIIRVVVHETERLEVEEVGGHGVRADTSGPNGFWERRAKIKVLNLTDEPIDDALVSVDIAPVSARCRGRLDRDSIRVVFADQIVPHALLGERLVCQMDVPAKSACTLYLMFYEIGVVAPAERTLAQDLVRGKSNLVQNPSFERGESAPQQWTSGAAGGVRLSLDSPGAPGLGQRCAKLVVPPGVNPAWQGWHQSIPVEAGATYLYAAWVRGDKLGDKVQLYAHCLTAKGKLCDVYPMRSAGPSIEGTADWTLMSALLPMPSDAARLDLHLTMNTTGTLWHDGVIVARVVPGKVVGFEGRPVRPEKDVEVWQVNSVVKVFPDDPMPRETSPPGISVAKNEWESLQLAVRSGQPRRGVRVVIDPLSGPDDARLDDISVNVVGYVPIDYPTSYYRSETPRWHRKFPVHRPGCDGWPGLWPDPLLPTDSLNLPANQTQAIWITVKTTPDTPVGQYTLIARLMHGDDMLAIISFRVHVRDFTLPEESSLAAIYDIRFGPGGKHWGKEFAEFYPEALRFLAERRLCGDHIRPAPKIAYRDGRVVADFAEFDKAARVYFDELDLPRAYMPHMFYLFGWGHPPNRRFGPEPYPGGYPYDDADRGKLNPEFKKAYQACLKVFWDHVKAKGWADRFVLYVSDEPHDHQAGIIPQMQALCDMIHEVDPAIPIYSSTWKRVPEWDGYLDVWGIGHYGRVPVDEMQQMKDRQDRLWFTTDGQMCTDTPYCAVERLLPHYCFKYDVEAYEFWGVSWLTYDPFKYGWHAYIHQSSRPGTNFYVRYPNGDGFLLYPGKTLGYDGIVSTIRLEQAREGVEDYEYLCLLRELTKAAEAKGDDVAAARAALEEASQLVEIPNAGGRYSSKVLPNPNRVLEVRTQIAEAIERLRTR